jgi:hypothetical protein
MVERITISTAEAAILTEGALDNDGFAHRPYNGVWVGDIKMCRSLEQRDLMQFVDYQEVLPAKDRVRRSRMGAPSDDPGSRMPDEPRSRS